MQLISVQELSNRLVFKKRSISAKIRCLQHISGCSAAWLARLTGGQKVGGSNPLSPIRPVSPSIEPIYLIPAA